MLGRTEPNQVCLCLRSWTPGFLPSEHLPTGWRRLHLLVVSLLLLLTDKPVNVPVNPMSSVSVEMRRFLCVCQIMNV